MSLLKHRLGLRKQLADEKTPMDKELLQRQIDATDRQIDRLVYEFCGLTCNADMGVAEVREFCGVADAGRGLLRAARPSWA